MLIRHLMFWEFNNNKTATETTKEIFSAYD